MERAGSRCGFTLVELMVAATLFTVILVATLIVWFLQSFSPGLELVSDPHRSILAVLGGLLAPLFAPIGFGDWRFVTALIAGFMAKETVVSTLTVLFSSTSSLMAALSPAAAASFLVFCLLYTPCIAAIAAVKRELGAKWAVGVVVLQCLIAWVVAFLAFGICLALGMG